MTKLLIRDLAEVVSAPGAHAPLRGPADMTTPDSFEDAYVLCEDGRVSAVGRMSDLGALDGDVEEFDGRGRSAVPGLVDCHTHACFAGDRVDDFSRRAAGATYEELHAAGGGILSTELAQLRVIREAGGIPTWLGAHAVPPEFSDAGAYLDFALQEVLPEAARLAEAADEIG